MRTRLLLVVTLAGAVPGAGQSANGVIAGRVIDAGSGQFIREAVVTIDAAGPAGAAAGFPSAKTEPGFLTDAQGRFIFEHLGSGVFALHVEKNGYLYGSYGQRRPQGNTQTIDLAPDRRVLDADIRVWRLASIAGQVLDETGQPIVGAMVTPFRRAFAGGRPTLTATQGTTTDDRGAYSCNVLPGEYIVGVTFRVSTTPVASLATNAPAPRIRLGDLAISSSSGPSGSYARVLDGRVWASTNTYAPSAIALDQATVVDLGAGGERSDVDIRVKSAPLVVVTGTVTGPAGPVAALALRLVPIDGLQFDSADIVTEMQGTSDADGHFTLLAAPGQYALETPSFVNGPAATLVASMPLTVGDSGLSGVALRAVPKHVLTGRFEFEGASPKPALRLVRLSLAGAEGRGLRPALTASDDGTLRSSAIGPGRFLVRILTGPMVSGPTQIGGWFLKSAMLNGRNVVDEAFEMKDADLSGLVVTFSDQPSTLTGGVSNAQGNADPLASVVVFPVDRAGWVDFGASPRRLATLRVDRSGAFVLRGLPAGEYFAVAVADELTVNWQSPGWLETASRVASRVRIEDGAATSIDLRTARW